MPFNIRGTPDTLDVYEADRHVPDAKMLKRLTKAYGVTVEDFQGSPTSMPVP